MKNIAALCMLAFMAMPAGALTLEELTGQDRAGRLAAGEALNMVQLKNPGPALVPSYPPLLNLIRQEMDALGPSICVETLRVYKKPEGANAAAWTARERLNIYNNALALSTLRGLRYFSSSRNAWRTLYESSTVIDGPESKVPLADPVYAEPLPELILYARQKDLTFGDNIYRYRYMAQSGALIFIQENVTAMSMGIIPALGRNRLRSIVAVIDAGPWLLTYAVSMARAASIPGMGTRIGNSFTTRADAVLSWFFTRADAAFRDAL